MTAYRQSAAESFIWVLITVAGLIASIAAALWLSAALDARGLSYWFMLPAALPFPASFVLAVRRMRRKVRERDAAIQRLFEQHGFLVDLAPSEERRQTVFKPVSHLEYFLELRGGVANIRWIGLRLPGWLLLEHEYTTGSGDSTASHTRIAAVLSATHPTLPRARLGNGPWVMLERANVLHRHVLKKREGFTTVNDPAFDKKWVTIGDAQAARAFLTPETIRELEQSPKGETWLIGYGYVCCAYRGALAPPQLHIMMQRMERLMA